MLSRETWIFEDARVTSERSVGVASRRGVNGTTDILWIEGRRPLSGHGCRRGRRRARTTVVAVGSQLGPAHAANAAGSGPDGSDVIRRTWRLAQEVRSLPIHRDVSSSNRHRHRALWARAPSPHAPRPISAKVRAITTLRINYSRCYLKIFVCDAERSRTAACRHGVAHANRFPAAGRLMGQAAPAPAEAPAHAHTATRLSPRRCTGTGANGTTPPHYHSADSRTPIDRGVGTTIRPSLYAHMRARRDRVATGSSLHTEEADAGRGRFVYTM